MHRVFQWVMVVALLIGGVATAAAQRRSDEVALTVNGEPIPAWEIGLLLPQIRSELTTQGVDPKGDILIRTAMKRAVESRLLAQEARRRGIEPNPVRIEEKLKTVADGAGGRADLEAELIKAGVTYSQLRDTVVQADLVQSLVEGEVGAGFEVTEETVATFYAENPELFKEADRIHPRHILFLVKSDASSQEREAARKKAAEAHERAMAGEDFAALAAELSEGPNASRGGDLGFTVRGQMVASFDDAVWALKVGEISEVVESDLGFHVIKIEEISIGETVPIEEARPLVEDLLRQQRTGQVLSDLIAQLRASADVRGPQG